jgi:hypothetical protein
MQLSTVVKMACLLACFHRTARAAPVATGKSNAPAGVPDYVIKYGMHTLTSLEYIQVFSSVLKC